jgi:tRNA pseudouridine55 synthase
MAKKRKGNPVSGWLLVDKPAGVTSTSVVGKVRWATDAQKAGHSGTLDPAATGLLAVALGEATKTVPYVTDALKCYRFRVRLGQSTTTDDAEGEVLATSDLRPDVSQIESALSAFRGQIQQVPPQFSAVKVDGERAYDLAREGEVLDLKARSLWVDALDIAGVPDADHVDLEMTCGKGGYVRSIARDLGMALGCHGHVVWLRRLWSGPFDVGDALTLEQIDAMAKSEDLLAHLRPLEDGLCDLPQVMATLEGTTRLRNGNPGQVIAPNPPPYGAEAWASYQGQAVAVGRYMGGELHPTRVFVKS